MSILTFVVRLLLQLFILLLLYMDVLTGYYYFAEFFKEHVNEDTPKVDDSYYLPTKEFYEPTGEGENKFPIIGGILLLAVALYYS